jgi:hypothetical protein
MKKVIAVITASDEGFVSFAEFHCNGNQQVCPMITGNKVKLSDGTTLLKVSSLDDAKGHQYIEHHLAGPLPKELAFIINYIKSNTDDTSKKA